MTTETEIAWAAGFFDGEGGTYGTRKRGSTYVTPKMAVGQTDLAVLERFQRAVGGGTIYAVTNNGNPLRRKQMWVWHVQKRDEVRRIFELLQPYLCQPKIDQAVDVIDAL